MKFIRAVLPILIAECDFWKCTTVLYCFNAKRNTYRVDVLSPPQPQLAGYFEFVFFFVNGTCRSKKLFAFYCLLHLQRRGRGGGEGT